MEIMGGCESNVVYSVQRQRKFAFQTDAEVAISLGSGQDALKIRGCHGCPCVCFVGGVSQRGLLSLDHKDVDFPSATQAEAAA